MICISDENFNYEYELRIKITSLWCMTRHLAISSSWTGTDLRAMLCFKPVR